MLIEEIKDDENLTYKIFIDKSINILEKTFIIVKQYNKIRINNIILENEINKSIKKSIKRYEFEDIIKDVDFDLKDDEELMKKIMNKLHKLNTFLDNYIKQLRNDIHNTYLNIFEIYKVLKYDTSKINMFYEKECKGFNNILSSYKDIEISNNIDEIFEYIINVSNNYKLITKNILFIKSIIFSGETLKKQNTILKNIYKELY